MNAIKRRGFITLLGGTAVGWPLAARAQQPSKPTIGFLHPASPETLANQLGGFRQGLKEAGFVESENLAIEYRWADNQYDRLPALAAELVRRRVGVIATAANGAFAAKMATGVIPIVFLEARDPVELGLVSSLARPGGNLTGINFFAAELSAKRLELLRQLVPAVVRVAILVNSSSRVAEELEAAAGAMGLQIQILNADTSGEIDAAFAQIEHERPDALFVGSSPFFTSRRVQLTHWATRLAIPATYAVRLFAEAGGLMSYGASLADAYRQVGIYVGRILKGAKPADLPVLQPTKFELVINHQTARMLGLTIPQTLLATADEVIE